MKKQTKIISVCMALALAVPAFSGCKGGGGSSLPTDKTIIFYQNYDCGYGSEYIEETCKKFAEAVNRMKKERRAFISNPIFLKPTPRAKNS